MMSIEELEDVGDLCECRGGSQFEKKVIFFRRKRLDRACSPCEKGFLARKNAFQPASYRYGP
jgi:hypothetical protein